MLYFNISDINPFFCLLTECGEVEAPANGVMNVKGLTFGHNITFECNKGYKVNGTFIIECLSSGNWSSSAPTCSLGTKGTVIFLF